ncbi:MAG TPA: hypothetical protein VFH80_15125 [Solirubrobacteraceae bacterium]|nr:hypothetical protein [Solirubrobacteraceae bacterium]
MVEVLITVERPASMGESEMRAWVSERARVARLAVSLGPADGAESSPLMLRVEFQHDGAAAEDQLADLMMDMRLLGLRPTVVSHRG